MCEIIRSAKSEKLDNKSTETDCVWPIVNAEKIIKTVDITTEAGIYAALDQASISDSLLYSVFKALKSEAGALRPVLDDAMKSVCFFYVQSTDSRMAALAKRYVRIIEGHAFKADLLKRYAGNLAGIELANQSGTQFAIFLPDASEAGRFRYSCFDKRGFFSHATFDNYQDALNGAWLAGFRVQVDGQLQSLCLTDDWTEGSKITEGIQLVNMGKLTHDQFLIDIAA